MLAYAQLLESCGALVLGCVLWLGAALPFDGIRAESAAESLYRFSKGLPLNLFSTNRGVNPLATAFVATGFTPGLICHKEQSFLEVVLPFRNGIFTALGRGECVGSSAWAERRIGDSIRNKFASKKAQPVLGLVSWF